MGRVGMGDWAWWMRGREGTRRNGEEEGSTHTEHAGNTPEHAGMGVGAEVVSGRGRAAGVGRGAARGLRGVRAATCASGRKERGVEGHGDCMPQMLARHPLTTSPSSYPHQLPSPTPVLPHSKPVALPTHLSNASALPAKPK
jgi:hypothetical protein